MSQSKIINVMLNIANELNLDTVTIKEIEALNLKAVEPMTPAQIKRLRCREKLSQAVLAKILNVTASTYQKWERGEVKPRGASLKLLRLANTHGINHVIN